MRTLGFLGFLVLPALFTLAALPARADVLPSGREWWANQERYLLGMTQSAAGDRIISWKLCMEPDGTMKILKKTEVFNPYNDKYQVEQDWHADKSSVGNVKCLVFDTENRLYLRLNDGNLCHPITGELNKTIEVPRACEVILDPEKFLALRYPDGTVKPCP